LGGFKCTVKLTSLDNNWFFGVERHLLVNDLVSEKEASRELVNPHPSQYRP
jgi:hypothetical protein